MSNNVLPIVEFFKTLITDQDRLRLDLDLNRPVKDDDQRYLRARIFSLERAIDIVAQSNFIINNPPTDTEVYQQVIDSYEKHLTPLNQLSNKDAQRGAKDGREFVLSQARLAQGQ